MSEGVGQTDDRPHAELVACVGTGIPSASAGIATDFAVAVVDGAVAEIGTSSAILQRYEADRVIEEPDGVMIPGLVNTHTHLFQSMLKGLGEGRRNAEWIRTVTVPALVAMEPRDIYLAAMVGSMDAVRSGTTFLVEYMYPNPRHEMGDAVLEAITDIGIRALLGRGVAELGDEGGYPVWGYAPDLVEPVEDALTDTRRLDDLARERSSGRVSTCLSPPNVRCHTPSSLERLREFASGTGMLITVHLCETLRDEEVTLDRYGMRPVAWLDDVGFLGDGLLLAHCINVDTNEIDRIADSGAAVSHNPVSNMYLGNGIAPVIDMLDAGVAVGLATDGAASNNSQDMLEVLKTTALLHRTGRRDPQALSSWDVFRLATTGGAHAVGNESVGTIEIGKRADFVILDYTNSKSTPAFDPIATLCFSADQRAVRWVVIDGRVVLDDGRIVGVDERALLREAQEAANDLVARAGLAAESYGSEYGE